LLPVGTSKTSDQSLHVVGPNDLLTVAFGGTQFTKAIADLGFLFGLLSFLLAVQRVILVVVVLVVIFAFDKVCVPLNKCGSTDRSGSRRVKLLDLNIEFVTVESFTDLIEEIFEFLSG